VTGKHGETAKNRKQVRDGTATILNLKECTGEDSIMKFNAVT
jgi:hypothetical protein